MTNLPVTSTIHVISNTILCTVEKKFFMEYIENFSRMKNEFMNRIKNYHDPYFNKIHKVLQNIPYIRGLSKYKYLMKNLIISSISKSKKAI